MTQFGAFADDVAFQDLIRRIDALAADGEADAPSRPACVPEV